MIFGFFKKKEPRQTAELQKAEVEGEEVGKVSHYFSHSKAAVLKLHACLNVGDEIHVKGHTTDFKQKVTSIQIDGKPITNAKKGDEVGLLVKDKVRAQDSVYKAS